MKKIIKSFVYVFILVIVMESVYYLSLKRNIENINLKETYEIKNESKLVSYELVDGKYKPTSEDPQIIFNDIKKFKAMEIEFSDNTLDDENVTVYYSKDGTYDENLSMNYKVNENTLKILILSNDVNSIRIDINNSFFIEKILCTDENVEITYIKNYNLSIRTLFFILLACVIYFFFPIKKSYNLLIEKVKEISNTISLKKLKKIIITFFLVSAISMITELLFFDYFIFRRFYFIFSIFLIIKILFSSYKFKYSIEKTFFQIILTAGMCLIIIIPIGPMISFDDETHYPNAASIASNGYTIADAFVFTRKIPLTYNEQLILENNNELNYLDSLGYRFVSYSSMGYIKSISYLPNSIGLLVGNILNFPFTITFLLGKITSLLFYSIVMYCAIKFLKSGKMILSLFALFPTNIYMACSYTYDTWLVSLLTFVFVIILGIMQDKNKKFNKKNLFLIYALYIVGCIAKPIYFPMILLTLLIPKEKYDSEKLYKNNRFAVIGVSLSLLLSFCLPFLVAGPSNVGDVRGGSDVNSFEQFIYIINHPFTYAKTLILFTLNYLSLSEVHKYMNSIGYIGMMPGNILLIITFFYTIITDKNKYDLNVKFNISKSIIYLLFYITICFTATSMYIAFTPVGINVINGCQPRYLLPILFPIFYLLGTSHNKFFENKDRYNLILYSIFSFVIIYGIWSLIIKIYV